MLMVIDMTFQCCGCWHCLRVILDHHFFLWMSQRLTGQVSCLKQLIYDYLCSVSFPLASTTWTWQSRPLYYLCREPTSRTWYSIYHFKADIEPAQRLMINGCTLEILTMAIESRRTEKQLWQRICIQMELNWAQLNSFIIIGTKNRTHGSMAVGHCLQPHNTGCGIYFVTQLQNATKITSLPPEPSGLIQILSTQFQGMDGEDVLRSPWPMAS